MVSYCRTNNLSSKVQLMWRFYIQKSFVTIFIFAVKFKTIVNEFILNRFLLVSFRIYSFIVLVKIESFKSVS